MNYKTARLIFFLLILTICIFIIQGMAGSLWLALPFIGYLGLIIYGSANIQSGFFIKSYNSGDTAKKEIAITFDDGPDNMYTPKILDTLKEFNTPATFFVIGKKIDGNETLLKKMDAEGHLIANHSYSHSFFIDFKNTEGFTDELNKTSDIIFRITGKRTQFFRPPYGVTTPSLAKASRKLNYDIIGWNVRSLDTTADNENKIAERVKQQLKPGSIILFHDTSEKTDRVLKQILIFAGQRGYQCVSLERLLNRKAYS